MFQFKSFAVLAAVSALMGIGGEAEARSCSSVSLGFGAQQPVYIAPAPRPVFVQPVERRIIQREVVGTRCAAPGYCQLVPVAPTCVEYVPVYQEVYVQRPPVVCRERASVFPFLSFSWSWFKR